MVQGLLPLLFSLEVSGAGEGGLLAGLVPLAERLMWVTCITPFLVAGGLFLLWMNYGREPKAQFGGELLSPPSDYPPAFVEVLYDPVGKRPEINGFIATLLDLARRGYIAFEVRDVEIPELERLFWLGAKVRKGVFLKRVSKSDGLRGFERELLDFLFAGKDEIEMGDLIRKMERDPGAWNFFRMWRRKASLEAEAMHFYEPRANEIVRKINVAYMALAALIILLALASLPLKLFASPIFTPVVVIGSSLLVDLLLLAISRGYIRARTPYGAEEYAKWEAFKRTLYSGMARVPPDPKLWEGLLVYATALGLRGKVMERIAEDIPEAARGLIRPAGGDLSSGLRAVEGSLAFLSKAMILRGRRERGWLGF